MRVLILTPTFPPEIGGPATYSAELLRRLPPKMGIKVVSFSVEKKSGDGRVKLVPISGGMIIRQLRLFLACLAAGKNSDIFYLQEPAVVGLAGLVAAKTLGKKVVMKYVGDPEWEEAMRGGTPGGRLAMATKFVLNRSERVIVPAKYLADLLTRYYRVDRRKIVVAPNSIEVPDRVPKKEKNSLVFAGRLVSWKNVDLILRAVAKIKEVRLKIVGDGPERGKLQILTAELGLEGRVRFLGRVSAKEAAEEIARSEILVLFSSYEGLPHVVLEAMANRTLVVASDIPGTRELVAHGKTGILVEPGNEAKLAEAIANAQRDKRLVERLTARARRLVRTDFSWQSHLNKLVELFR